jgi:hypothetical protein
MADKKRKLELILKEEDLALTKISDDNEPDELDNLPLSKLTKGARYFKDGWILEDNEFICIKCNKVFKKKNFKKDDICKKCN